MALIACKECKAQISTEAKACPQCGAKPPAKTSVLTWIIGAFFLFVVVRCSVDQANKPTAAPPAPKSGAEKKADDELNTAIAVGSMLKKAAKDPSSFKMESFLIYPGGAACYEYRAKNSFGALVPAKAVYDGKTALTSEHDGNKFVKSWNAICTKPGGAERAGGLNLLGVW